MKIITIDPKYTKTYKTEGNLMKALDDLNLPDNLACLICEVKGRFTAVFTNTLQNPGYTQFLAARGFKVVG